MTVLIANQTPYVIWSYAGSLVGACRTKEQAIDIMRDLKRSFPEKDYVCRDVDGDLCGDTATMRLSEEVMSKFDAVIDAIKRA